MYGGGVVRTWKMIILVVSNYDIDDINRIIKWLGVVMDGVSEIVKHEIKRHEGGLFGDIVRKFRWTNVRK